MGRSSGGGQNVDIRIRAINEASPALNEVAGDFKKLPREIGHAASAFGTLAGASGQMGEEMSKATAHVSRLIPLIMSGGPIGIGIAAITGAVVLGSAVWDTYKIQEEAVGNAAKGLGGTFETLQKTLDAQTKSTQSAADMLKYFGMTSREVHLAETSATLDASTKSAEALKSLVAQEQRSLETMKAKLLANKENVYASGTTYEALAKENDELAENIDYSKMQIAALQKQVAYIDKTNESRGREIDSLVTLGQREDEHAAHLKSVAAETKRAEEATTKYIAAMNKQGAGGWEARTDAAKTKLFERTQRRYQAEKKLDDWLTQNEIKNINKKEHLEKGSAEAQKKREEQQIALAGQVGDIWTSVFSSMISNSDEAGKSMLKGVVRTVKAAIDAYIVQGMAGAIAGSASIGPIGIAIGLALSAVIAGLIEALLSKLPSFASGGLVTGGIPGIDSVPILAQQGERVLSVREARNYERGGGLTQQFMTKTVFAPNSADTKRQARDVGRAMQRLRAHGFIT